MEPNFEMHMTYENKEYVLTIIYTSHYEISFTDDDVAEIFDKYHVPYKEHNLETDSNDDVTITFIF